MRVNRRRLLSATSGWPGSSAVARAGSSRSWPSSSREEASGPRPGVGRASPLRSGLQQVCRLLVGLLLGPRLLLLGCRVLRVGLGVDALLLLSGGFVSFEKKTRLE